MRVLMVEDEKFAAQAVAEVLRKNKYTVDLAHDGEDGLEFALCGLYDIIILDIMLPKRDGLSILRELRVRGMSTPVILLSAKGQLEDKIAGLDFGADDYLPKPYHVDELLARLRALSRRRPELDDGGVIAFGDIRFSPHKLTLERGGGVLRLKLKEAQMLELLICNKNTVLSKNAIIEKVWGYDTQAEDNNVESHIWRLRRHLAQLKSAAVIKTIRGAGYTLTFSGDGDV